MTASGIMLSSIMPEAEKVTSYFIPTNPDVY